MVAHKRPGEHQASLGRHAREQGGSFFFRMRSTVIPEDPQAGFSLLLVHACGAELPPSKWLMANTKIRAVHV